MDRLCSTIFLCLVIGVLISKALQEERLNVHLEPKFIQVCEEESVTINCTFQPRGKYKVKCKVYYSPTSDLDCNSPTDKIREKWLINTENNDTWSTFIISSVKTDDSGWYFCKITKDVPVLIENCSNGIQVLVDANCSPEYPNQTDNQTQNPTTADLPTIFFYNTLQEERLNVHLEPKYIQVCEGESVTINCTYQPGGEYKVKWYYSPTPDVDCNSPTVRTSEKWLINTENNKTWSTFNISSIKTDDSGWYFCKVKRDIPVVEEKCSDGIQVLVDGQISSIEAQDALWMIVNHAGEHDDLVLHKHANCSPEYPTQPDNRQDNQTQIPSTADLPTNFLCNNFLLKQLNVHLEPKYIQVCEGESVTINCTYQPCGKYKVKLYYSPRPDLDCNSATVRTSEKWRITENNDTWSTFNISSIQTDDSGWYFCMVTRDIPVLVQNCSDGIQVVVNSTCRIMACI